jgi:DNA-binding transcriptional regulator YhcF (GntR family)
MASNYWAKLWVEMLDDRKVASLPDSQYRRFIECILLAKDYNRDGLLPSIEDMAWKLRLTTETLQNDMSRLALAGLVELVETTDGDRWFVTKFADRQRASTPTERTNLRREALSAKRYEDDTETELKRFVSQSKSKSKKQKVEAEKEAEAEAEKIGARADAAAAYLKQFGIAYNAKTAPIADMPEDYIRGHIEHMRKNGDKPGLAITRMLDGDPVPGSRPVDLTRQIPADLADIIQR